MKIGIFVPTFGEGHQPQYLRTLAETAEQVGAACLWAPEHVVLTREYSSPYPYSPDGRFPLDPSAGGLGDPFAVLCFLAGLTTTIRLATGICLVPQRNPVYTAKLVAQLDVLSNGRFDFGVGIGWLREEFAAVAAEFEPRAARTRAYLEVMRRLWSEPFVDYSSEHYSLKGVSLAPKPVQQPHPPIIFGGESDAALRRVADLGQGWFGWNITPEEATERVRALDELLAERGRRRASSLSDLVAQSDQRERAIAGTPAAGPVRIIASPYIKPTQDIDAIKRYRDAGVEQVVLLLFDSATIDSMRASIERLGDVIIEPARQL